MAGSPTSSENTDQDHPLEHQEVSVCGQRLHVVTQGRGPVVLFLHGFPEYWHSWSAQMAAVARAGYRAVAPDLRGYNLSDKPRGTELYRLSTLVADAHELVCRVSPESPVAALVAHDWGGMIAWQFAGCHPEQLERLVILNALPPHLVLASAGPRQWLKSWYVLFFQLPWLPEFLLTRKGMIKRVFRWTAVNSAAFSEENLDGLEAAMAQPGAARATVSYYRALRRFPPDPERPISAPTHIIWGTEDRFLDEAVLDGVSEIAPGLERHRLPVGHWVQTEASDEVDRLLLEILARDPEPS